MVMLVSSYLCLSAAEVGDYDHSIHHTGYVTEFKLLPVLVSELCVYFIVSHFDVLPWPHSLGQYEVLVPAGTRYDLVFE